MKRFSLTALLTVLAVLAVLAILGALGPPRASGSSIVWAVGDGADGGSDSREVAAMIASRRVDRFAYLGDVYASGTAAEFASNYRPVFGRFDSIAAPVIGNHEYAYRESGFQPYWSAVRGSRMPLRYQLRAAGWQLLFLDSNVPADAEQLGWLRRHLSRGRFGSCRIAFMHHPRHSAGGHGDDPEQGPLWSALRGRVRLTIAGRYRGGYLLNV